MVKVSRKWSRYLRLRRKQSWLLIINNCIPIKCSSGCVRVKISQLPMKQTSFSPTQSNIEFRVWDTVFSYYLRNTNRSPADEASRTQNSANRASPKGAPDWLSFEYGELHLPDFLCVLWARTHFSDSEKLLQLIRHTMWRRSVSSCINKKIITDIVVYYFVHYERQASTKDLCFHVCCFFGIGIE